MGGLYPSHFIAKIPVPTLVRQPDDMVVKMRCDCAFVTMLGIRCLSRECARTYPHELRLILSR